MLTKELNEAMRENRIVIGSRRVMKGMKRGDLKKVLSASNCPEEKMKELEYYASRSKIKVEKFKENSSVLGEFCGKPFNVLIIGIKK